MTWVEGAIFLWASVDKYLVLDIFHVLDLLDRLISLDVSSVALWLADYLL